jgi:hypothetical protein
MKYNENLNNLSHNQKKGLIKNKKWYIMGLYRMEGIFQKI